MAVSNKEVAPVVESSLSKTTVFVRSIPTTATDEELEAVFSDIGPVKKCFVVSVKSDSSLKNRGFGYVNFAFPEDAATAVANSGSFQLNGITLQISMAQKRETLDTRNLKKRASETTVVNDLKHVNQKEKEKVDKFLPRKNAFSLTEDVNVAPVSTKRFKINPDTTSRLIVRNLSFKCNVDILRTIFSKYGTVTDCLMPRKQEPEGPYRGFGIVQFSRRVEASQALKELNATKVCDREIAIDWCLPQPQFLAAEGFSQQEISKRFNDKFDNKKAKAQIQQEEQQEEVKTVKKTCLLDDKLSIKDKIKDNNNFLSKKDRDIKNVATKIDMATIKKDRNNTKKSDGSASKEEEHTLTSSIVNLSPRVEDGTTIFLRNLHFDATNEEVQAVFESFGKVEYVSINRDKATSVSKGTAFVCFSLKESADNCIKAVVSAAALQKDLRYNQLYNMRNNDFVPKTDAKIVNSVLVRDIPAISKSFSEKNIVSPILAVRGMPLLVDRALPRGEAAALRSSVVVGEQGSVAAAGGARFSARNVHLLLEGTRGDNVVASERELKLRENIALFVSPTRLCIRRLPKSVGRSELKKLAHAAARFWNQQEAPSPKITKETTRKKEPTGTNGHISSSNSSGNVVKRVRPPKQGIVVMSKEANEVERSKGYGFVEFDVHEDAMSCVRGLADPKIQKRVVAEVLGESIGANLSVEFAIENKQAVNMRKARISRQQDQAKFEKTCKSDRKNIDQNKEPNKERKAKVFQQNKPTIKNRNLKVGKKGAKAAR